MMCHLVPLRDGPGVAQVVSASTPVTTFKVIARPSHGPQSDQIPGYRVRINHQQPGPCPCQSFAPPASHSLHNVTVDIAAPALTMRPNLTSFTTTAVASLLSEAPEDSRHGYCLSSGNVRLLIVISHVRQGGFRAINSTHRGHSQVDWPCWSLLFICISSPMHTHGAGRPYGMG